MVHFTAHFYIIHILFNNVAGINLVVAHSDAVNLSYIVHFCLLSKSGTQVFL